MAEINATPVPNVPWSKQTGTSGREKSTASEVRFCTSHEDERVEAAIEKAAGYRDEDE